MAKSIQTLLFLDPQPASQAVRLFDSSDTIVLSVKDADRAHHALTTMEIAVFICDLSTSGLNAKVLMDTARKANPAIQIIPTGASSQRNATLKLAEAGLIGEFVPRPWQTVDLRSAVSHARARYVEARPDSLNLHSRSTEKTGQVFSTQPDSRISTEADSNRYQILEKIGEGGTGAVWKAHDLLLGMDVAVKILHPSLAADVDAVAAMKQEAVLAMQLAHSCIVRLYNFARVGNNYFLVMELVKGRTFHSLLVEAGSFTPHAVNEIIHVCSDAVDYAHRHGVLHNDLKPANILLNSDNVIKIIDFGVACLVDHQREAGEIIGTPEYMSPEQLRGERLGPQTDVYALGIIAYQLLTGRLPYPEGMKFEEIESIERGPIAGLPPALTAILETATAYESFRRYGSVADFARAFAHAFHLDFGDGGSSDGAPVVSA